MKIFSINNIQCYIGSNADENWKLLENSKPTDILFHLSSFPSCYVILENESIEFPSTDIIKEVALNCKLHTKYKNLKNIKVDYTLCKNVEKGENIGELIYKSNRKVLSIKV
jgi:predicted ribosome quality control (RQC) complex YloA/Tae2 family protein